MAYAIQVAATAFAKEFGKYSDEATASGGVEVTSHGRLILENFERLKNKEHRVMNSEYGKASE